MKSEWKCINQKRQCQCSAWIVEKNTKIDIPVGTVPPPLLIGRSSPVTPACSSPAEDWQPNSKIWGSYFLLTFNSRPSEVIPEHVGSYMRGKHKNSKGITTSTMTHSNRLEPRLMAGLFNGQCADKHPWHCLALLPICSSRLGHMLPWTLDKSLVPKFSLAQTFEKLLIPGNLRGTPLPISETTLRRSE